jgi:hypothetical protein
MGLLAEGREQFADEPVGGLDVVGEWGVGIEGRHAIDTDEDRRCDREFSIEHEIGTEFSGGLRGGQGGPGESPGVTRVDPFEDCGHLGGSNLDAAVLGLREAGRAFFEAFVPQGQAVAVPVEDLDPVTSAVGEDVEVSRERILGDPIADELGEAVERWRFMMTSVAGRVRSGRREATPSTP